MEAGSFLDRMAQSSRERVRLARAKEPESALVTRARARPSPPKLVLSGFDVIAELKLRSPAAGGLIEGDFSRHAQIEAYARGGAAAVSVLTEPDEFHGSLSHLEQAASALAPLDCPVMRKDFLTAPYQVLEARAAGAGGVLVVVTMLADEDVLALVECARENELFVLLEGFDIEDFERIAGLGFNRDDHTILVGVNCRDLKNLKVSFERFVELADCLPRHLPAVAESGIATADDVRAVAELSYSVALVGSSLMRAADPRETLRDFIARGRMARSGA